MPLREDFSVKVSLVDRANGSPPEVFLEKCILKICSNFTGEHQYQTTISFKLLCNFIEIAPRDGGSPVNLLHIFRIPFPKNTFGGLFLTKKIKMFIILPPTRVRLSGELR